MRGKKKKKKPITPSNSDQVTKAHIRQLDKKKKPNKGGDVETKEEGRGNS